MSVSDELAKMKVWVKAHPGLPLSMVIDLDSRVQSSGSFEKAIGRGRQSLLSLLKIDESWEISTELFVALYRLLWKRSDVWIYLDEYDDDQRSVVELQLVVDKNHKRTIAAAETALSEFNVYIRDVDDFESIYFVFDVTKRKP